MLNGDSAFNGNSFADLGMHADMIIRPVPTWKFGVSQAAAMSGARRL